MTANAAGEAIAQVLGRLPVAERPGHIAELLRVLVPLEAGVRDRHVAQLRAVAVPEHLGAEVFDALARRLADEHAAHLKARKARVVGVIGSLLEPFDDETRFAILGAVRGRLQRGAT